MGRSAEILDAIIAGKAPRPPHVETLRLPGITGWEPGRVWGRWTVDSRFFHLGGAVFGGYLAAIADGVVALAMMSTLGDDERFTTSDLRVSFFRPVDGPYLDFEGTVVHRGRRMAHVEASFVDDNGRVACKASATQVVVPAAPETR